MSQVYNIHNVRHIQPRGRSVRSRPAAIVFSRIAAHSGLDVAALAFFEPAGASVAAVCATSASAAGATGGLRRWLMVAWNRWVAGSPPLRCRAMPVSYHGGPGRAGLEVKVAFTFGERGYSTRTPLSLIEESDVVHVGTGWQARTPV